MNRDLRMRKVLQATILSAEVISIPTNKKSTKAVGYIYDNKSWESYYVLFKIIFTCLRVLRLADSYLAGMYKVYYYSIITKHCIEEKTYDIEYQILFPDILPLANVWNELDE